MLFEVHRRDVPVAARMEARRVAPLALAAAVGPRREALMGRIQPAVTMLWEVRWQAGRARAALRAAGAPR